MIVDKVSELIGNTPMLRVPVPHRETQLLLKMEKMNPGGSTKDRMAHSMVLAAIKAGRLEPGGVIVESSSGNTGIGLAIAAVEFGLRFIAVVDHHAAPDKIAVMRALGAEIRYVEGDYREDEVAVVERQRLAAQIAGEIPGAIFMNQSDNTANAGGYSAFVREAIEQGEGRIDAYVGCVGTGGSMTGIGRGLKAHNAETVIAAVEPDGSIVFGGPGHAYYQSGTGTPQGDTVGLVLDYGCIDLGLRVTDSQAFETARYFARCHGLLVGGSTGGTLYKALELVAERRIGGNVLVSVADGGEKYLQTIFNDAWMEAKGLRDPGVWERLDEWLGRPAAGTTPAELPRLAVA
ncbi:cysteine synthase [Methylobacterium variabile]|jgi:cystathionine beta-synthase|uniref:Cysteine synthase n=1 Tax=Methylobacterium variabile TaxID=298794 RepID=A0A0J6V000_9HYPH|nr:cysteine synthase family protein [Methylobacterium variabile]KMO32081.1 cysteine synthase [Methylobacterium variabile]